MKRFKDSHIITEFCKVGSTCKTSWTRSYDGNLMAVRLCNNRFHSAIVTAPVCNKTLQLADCNRFTFHSENTTSLTLCFLRTNASTHSWKRRVFCDDRSSRCEVSCGNLLDELRYLHAYGTCSHATRILAIKTS